MTATYTRQIAAHIYDPETQETTDRIAILPDAVGADQRAHDGETVTVLVDGDPVPAILRGDLYALGESGTGDPVVALVEATEDARTYRIEVLHEGAWIPAPGESSGWTRAEAERAVEAGIPTVDGSPAEWDDARIVAEDDEDEDGEDEA